MSKRGDRRRKKKKEKGVRSAASSARPKLGESSTAVNHTANRMIRKKGVGVVLNVALFVIGIVVGLFFQTWFVSALPGPRVEAWLTLHSVASGCAFYSVRLLPSRAIEQFDLKVQVHNRIDDYIIGVAGVDLVTNKSTFTWKVDKDGTGKCIVSAAELNNFLGVSASIGGSTMSMQGANVPGNELIVAVIATKSPTALPALPDNFDGKFYEGTYRYSILGLPVKKDLVVTFSVTQQTP